MVEEQRLSSHSSSQLPDHKNGIAMFRRHSAHSTRTPLQSATPSSAPPAPDSPDSPDSQHPYSHPQPTIPQHIHQPIPINTVHLTPSDSPSHLPYPNPRLAHPTHPSHVLRMDYYRLMCTASSSQVAQSVSPPIYQPAMADCEWPACLPVFH